ncbi:hypothetical protein AAFP32_05655 [Brevibacterium sp. CBA3109]|uniref:Uncharacterized protein n=1 Tax=Brevibacterium koreense TaxID=3140787 RepID=A0AAU7UPA3_9MICO
MVGEPRIILSGSWVIRDWTVAAHTVIVLDRTVVVHHRSVVVRHRSVVVDDRAITVFDRLTACPVVRNTRIMIDRRLTLVGDPRIVGDGLLVGDRSSVIDATIVSGTTIVSNARVIGSVTFVCCRTCVGDRTIIGNPRVVTRVTLISNLTLVSNPTIIGNPTVISNPTLVSNPTVIGNPRVVITMVLVRCMTVSGNRSGSRLPIAMRVHVRIELIGVLELAFVLKTRLLGQTIAFSGVGVQLLGLGGLALGFCSLNFSVGVGLLRFGLAVFGVRFPSMDFMLVCGGFLPDAGGLLALVFALLSRGLSADRDDDADDNQNYDDRYDYPDDGSCTHALSPCCLFGSH